MAQSNRRVYQILGIQPARDSGFEAMIAGPGIGRAGVPYWFVSEAEAHQFVRELNLAYADSTPPPVPHVILIPNVQSPA
jgi:hypothetical protein